MPLLGVEIPSAIHRGAVVAPMRALQLNAYPLAVRAFHWPYIAHRPFYARSKPHSRSRFHTNELTVTKWSAGGTRARILAGFSEVSDHRGPGVITAPIACWRADRLCTERQHRDFTVA